MTLRCQNKGMKCPPYKHEGVFYPDDATIERLLPDMKRCANCTAFAPPQYPDLEDDLLQIAAVVILKQGPEFNPKHQSGASFGTFIRSRICGTLLNTKNRELERHRREMPHPDTESDVSEEMDAEIYQGIKRVRATPDLNAEFEDDLVRDLSFQQVLPELLQMLTERERAVFNHLREDLQNYEIAEALNLSASRVSRLVKQVMLKSSQAGQHLGLRQ